MKKLVIALLMLSAGGYCFGQTKDKDAELAQDKNITGALEALFKKSYDEAKNLIDDAQMSVKTKDKPLTLFTKVRVYDMLQDVDKYKDANLYRDEAAALIKLTDMKPDYEKTAVDQYLVRCAFLYFNDGAKAYNDKNLKDAAELMKQTLKIRNMGGGKRFEKYPNKAFDTICAEAKLTVGNVEYYTGKYDDAVSNLEAAKTNPISKSAAVYECLIDAYSKQNDSTNMLSCLKDARKTYPDDIIIRNYEIKYYMNYGKKEDLIKKMEDAAAKDPSNSDMFYNLATAYYNLAEPKNGKKAPNAGDLIAKAEENFKTALKNSPDNIEYNFNMGIVYFNEGNDENDQMAGIKSSSEADKKNFDDLKAKRDNYYNTAIPYFEKAYGQLSATGKGQKGEHAVLYKNTLYALYQMYGALNKADKNKEYKAKYDALGN
jgi:hypothetical protein